MPAVLRRLGAFALLLGVAAAALVVARPRLRAWQHLRAARADLQHYHNPQAIRHLQICREVWPRDAEVCLLAARAARRARVYGDSERLLHLYRDVRGRDEAFILEQLLLAVELRVNETEEQCWQNLEEGRHDAPLLLEALTRGYLRQYRLGQARRSLDRWFAIEPDNPQALYLEGLLLFDYLHVPATAVASYRKAVERDPDHEEARLGLALALLATWHTTEAAEQFERLRQSQSDNVRVQLGLAECLSGLGQSDEAVRLVDDVLARQPESAPALSLRGQIAFQSGQLEEAETWLQQTLHRDPRDHRARYSLILCLERSGRTEEARQQRQEMQQQEEEAARFHTIVTRDLAQRPTDPALHCELGRLLLRGGQREEALRWLQSALHLDPHYGPARQALQECLRDGKPAPTPQPPAP